VSANRLLDAHAPMPDTAGMSTEHPDNSPERHLFRAKKLWPDATGDIAPLGVSLSASTGSAAGTGFTLFDESVAFRQFGMGDVENLNSTSGDDCVILTRIGLDDQIHACNDLHTGEIDYAGVMQAFEQLEHEQHPCGIDVLLLDGCASMQRPELNNEMHFTVAMEGGYKALEELKSNDDIKAFGLVSDSAEFCQRALYHGDWDLFLLNHRYTLLEQWPLFNLLPECEDTMTSIVVGHAFNTGALRGKPRWNFAAAPAHIQARVENIIHICRLHDVPVEAVALQFPLAHPAVLSVVINEADQLDPGKIDQWVNQPLPASLWDDLKLGGVMHEEAPIPQPVYPRSTQH